MLPGRGMYVHPAGQVHPAQVMLPYQASHQFAYAPGVLNQGRNPGGYAAYGRGMAAPDVRMMQAPPMVVPTAAGRGGFTPASLPVRRASPIAAPAPILAPAKKKPVPKPAAKPAAANAAPPVPKTAPPVPKTAPVPATFVHSECVPPCSGYGERRLRSASEHYAQFPHRFACRELVGTASHWVDQPADVLAEQCAHRVKFTPSPEPAIVPERQQPGEDLDLNLRAFFPLGIAESSGRDGEDHVLKRFEIVAAHCFKDGKTCGRGYGVLVSSDLSEEERVDALCRAVEAETGSDLSGVPEWRKLVEFNYDGTRPDTVFYVPDITHCRDEGLSLRTSYTETEESCEEEEDAREESADAPKKKTKRTTVASPWRTNLAHMLQVRGGAGTDPDFLELCAAVDALDEWYRRDASRVVVEALEGKREAALLRAGERQMKRKAADDLLSVPKRARIDKEAALTRKWAAEDSALKPDAISALKGGREQQLAALAEEEKAAAEGIRSELRQAEAAAQRSVRHERSVRHFDAFQVFDRPLAGINPAPLPPYQLGRDYLTRCLLAGGCDLREARSLTSLGGTLLWGQLAYQNLASVEVEWEAEAAA